VLVYTKPMLETKPQKVNNRRSKWIILSIAIILMPVGLLLFWHFSPNPNSSLLYRKVFSGGLCNAYGEPCEHEDVITMDGAFIRYDTKGKPKEDTVFLDSALLQELKTLSEQVSASDLVPSPHYPIMCDGGTVEELIYNQEKGEWVRLFIDRDCSDDDEINNSEAATRILEIVRSLQ